jgi:hypothetical protein
MVIPSLIPTLSIPREHIFSNIRIGEFNRNHNFLYLSMYHVAEPTYQQGSNPTDSSTALKNLRPKDIMFLLALTVT